MAEIHLKASATDREVGLAAAQIALVWMLLTGNPAGWTGTLAHDQDQRATASAPESALQ